MSMKKTINGPSLFMWKIVYIFTQKYIVCQKKNQKK